MRTVEIKSVNMLSTFRKLKAILLLRISFLQSLDICRAIWDSDWYYLNTNNQKMIQLLILSSQKPKFVKVPFFEVTLNAYTKVISNQLICFN